MIEIRNIALMSVVAQVEGQSFTHVLARGGHHLLAHDCLGSKGMPALLPLIKGTTKAWLRR